MQPNLRQLIVASLVFALSACSSTGSSETGNMMRSRKVDTDAQESAKLQVRLGQGYLTEGQLAAARDKLQRALELDPQSVDAHTLMAVLSERISRPKAAEAFYLRATELKPEDGSVNNNYGAFLCASGRFKEAEPFFQRALNDPFYQTPAVATTNAGTCALKAGELERAEVYLRQSIELEPNNTAALFELARIHFSKSDFLRARAFLQRYEAHAEKIVPEALDLGAVIEEKSGNAEAAAQYRNRLTREFPQYAPSSNQEGTPSS